MSRIARLVYPLRTVMKALIVEDDAEIAQIIARVLGEEGFAVDVCDRGAEALDRIRAAVPTIVLLDWTLPDLDGLTICREVRRSGTAVPIVMLTARSAVRERIEGLEAGADDYIVKPFEVSELLARIHAILRRTQGRLQLGALELDRLGHRALLEGAPLDLTSREYTLLLYLAQQKGRVVPRSELLTQVWATRVDPGSNIIDVQVSRLRDKLGPHAWMIDTVRGQGYRLRLEPP